MLEKAKKLLQELNNKGYQAFLVGGCVRDILLERTPKDWDITTDATPDEIKIVFPNHYPVGEKYGTIGVKVDEDLFEITTFRSESDYDGRRPDKVQFEHDPKKDVERRDFTINGLLMNVDELVIDFVGGRKDLKERIIRCIGIPKQRFEEDYLRVLRGVRFATQLLFDFDDYTYGQMAIHINGLEKISKERIKEELEKILTSESPHIGISLLTHINGWEYIIPEVNAMKDCEQPPQFHKHDVYNHTWHMLVTSNKPMSFEFAMAVLLHDIGKPRTKGWHNGRITFYGHEDIGADMARDICNNLRFSNEQKDKIVWLVKNHMKPHQSPKMGKSKLAHLCREEHIIDLIELNRLDCLNSNGNMTNWEFINKFYKDEQHLISTKPLLNGDLLRELGFKPGPIFKELIKECLNRQLEGKIITLEQAIEWAKGEKNAHT